MAIIHTKGHWRLEEMTIEKFYDYAKSLHGLNLKPQGKEVKTYAKSIADFDQMETESSWIIQDLIEEGEFVLLMAGQKKSKSLLALDFSLMIACGESIDNRLSVIKPDKVLLIDTEMPENKFSSRVKKLSENYTYKERIIHNFRFICIKGLRRKIDLSTADDQKWIENEIKDAKFIVFDNLGGFLPYGSEKNESFWEPVSLWFKSLTSKGLTVFLVHHLNKSGEHRGTGKITDDVDLVLTLKKPESCPSNKTIIEFTITDARYLHGNQRDPFEIEYYEENKIIKRIVRPSDVELNKQKKSIVTEKEISEHGLTDLQIEMLSKARDPKTEFIKAGMFSNSDIKGRSASSITNILTDLCTKGLLEKSGIKNGVKYKSVPAQQNDI
ncbi:MAG: AAA family ATPase [Deltaproteobacteria bacterium]|nr:AAA family ATPase [Deltaproteobacteria bacterium]